MQLYALRELDAVHYDRLEYQRKNTRGHPAQAMYLLAPGTLLLYF